MLKNRQVVRGLGECGVGLPDEFTQEPQHEAQGHLPVDWSCLSGQVLHVRAGGSWRRWKWRNGTNWSS
jgi:hypothetical protein